MALEQIRLGNAIEMALTVRGDMNVKMIAPFLLLPFIENSFKQSNPLGEQSWINMDISMEGDMFTMKLANDIMPEDTALPMFPEDTLLNVKKRLSLIYPKRHELKITCERDMLIVLLKIDLAETDEDILINEQSKPPSKAYAVH